MFSAAVERRLAELLLEAEARIVNQITINVKGVIMATVEDIKNDLADAAGRVAVEGQALPPGYVAVAQADLDAIDTSVKNLIAALTPPPVTGTPPAGTGPAPVTPGPAAAVSSAAAVAEASPTKPPPAVNPSSLLWL